MRYQVRGTAIGWPSVARWQEVRAWGFCRPALGPLPALGEPVPLGSELAPVSSVFFSPLMWDRMLPWAGFGCFPMSVRLWSTTNFFWGQALLRTECSGSFQKSPSSPPTAGSMGGFLSAVCSGNLTAPGGKTHQRVGFPSDWTPPGPHIGPSIGQS